MFAVVMVRAQAVEDFSRGDRAATLYATRLTFNRHHVPVITVGIMDGQRSITVSSRALRFLPDGEGGPSIDMPGGITTCTATVSRSTPASVKYYVVLDEIPALDLNIFTQRFKKLQARGLKLKQFQVGSVFGFYGHILDNRKILITRDKAFDSIKKAKAEQAKTRPDLRVHAMLVTPPKGRITIKCKGHKIIIKSNAYIYFSSGSRAPVTVKKVEFGRGFSWHSREDRRYTGLMYFAVDRNGKLAVVNAVDAETMLAGLVPSEMPHSAKMEALKAQAVAARNELFTKLGNRHTADPYMLCSDVHCQVYRGLGRENPRTTAAVKETRGLLLFMDKKPVDTVYSSNCGGVNESPNAIWGSQDSGLPGGLLDTKSRKQVDFSTGRGLSEFLASPPGQFYCSAYKRTFRWKVRRTRQEMRVSVMNRVKQDPGMIQDIRVVKRGPSGRALKMVVKGRKQSVVLNGELVIRQAMGGLKSALFIMKKQRSADKLAAITFTGGGFGHGAGMCQVGAMGMAKKGKGFKTILKHYYPGASLLRIY